MLSLLTLTIIFALLLANVKCQPPLELEAVQVTAQFPIPIAYTSSIYAGDGKIYIFGGSNGSSFLNDIFLYDVNTDSLSHVGSLPIGTYGGALEFDTAGNILHFGGTLYTNTIYAWNPTTGGTAELVGSLPRNTDTRGSLRVVEDRDLVFSLTEVYEVNLTTYEVTSRPGPPIRGAMGVAWDGTSDNVTLFDRDLHQLYSISEGRIVGNFSSPEPHEFSPYHGIVSTQTSAFIFGNLGGLVGRGDCIVQVDFESLEFTFWRVRNYPVSQDTVFYAMATTYVPELSRVYIFGGVAAGMGRSEIWYIDLP